MSQKKTICIISFSPIYRDARVLRQIKYLSAHYDLDVIGYGEPHPDWKDVKNIKWHVLKMPLSLWLEKLIGFIYLTLGRFKMSFYDHWYWRKRHHQDALEMAIANKCNVYHANDWEALPIAAKAVELFNAKLVFDAHEYAPLELENRWYWKIFFRPAITYFIKKYSSKIDITFTVAPIISNRYKEEFGLNAKVILNAPERENLLKRNSNFNKINLVHHGGAIRDRRLERLIKTLSLCNSRFHLHLILLDNDPVYLKRLKSLAQKLTPGRVTFHEPVPTEHIVKRISEYDIGFYLLEPNSFNNIAALPNKFFDFIIAGLAVCIGPSPSMAEIVNQHGLGCVAPSFDPHDVAKILNRLTVGELLKMQLASQEAALEINAQKEMGKLVNLYEQLLG